MKLKITRVNLIGDGMNLPINIVIKETTFRGNRQYPNIHALWKNDLSINLYTFLSRENLR